MPIGRLFALTERKERLCARSRDARNDVFGTGDCDASLAMTVRNKTQRLLYNLYFLTIKW